MLVVVVVACAFLLNSSVHVIGVMNSLKYHFGANTIFLMK